MDLRQVWILYAHEVRSALRERSIVVGSIVVPLVMYPALLWAMFAGMSFIAGQTEGLTSRVALEGAPQGHGGLVAALDRDERITVSLPSGDNGTDPRVEIARGSLDALVEFSDPSADAAAIPDNVQVVIAFNEARDRSRLARARVESALESYRRDWIERERERLGIPDPVWSEYGITRDDIATPEESSRLLLALVVPFLILITVALAAFYPAVDATAGERERSTWETLMTVAAPRAGVATAKYLYVATFGAMGGLLNLVALVLSLRWIMEPLAGDGVQEITRGGLPLSALPVIAVGTALLGLFVAAGMLVFAVFARNFKEGQSMITPFFMVIILPALFVQSPEIEFTVPLALLPIVNVALLIREALLGSIPVLQASITLAMMGACVALSVFFAQWVMRREEVLFGSESGGLWTFLKQRVLSDRSGA